MFHETPLEGVWEIDLERIVDDRGWFARSFDEAAFRERGLNPNVVQCNVSSNARAGTIRGMHYQEDPHSETKLVRCTAGAIFDVALDLRPHSPSYLRWHGVELSAASGRALYLPEGIAHGFQTLADGSEVLYMMGAAYAPQAARGVRFDDPAFAIEWPDAAPAGRTISERDASYPDFER